MLRFWQAKEAKIPCAWHDSGHSALSFTCCQGFRASSDEPEGGMKKNRASEGVKVPLLMSQQQKIGKLNRTQRFRILWRQLRKFCFVLGLELPPPRLKPSRTSGMLRVPGPLPSWAGSSNKTRQYGRWKTRDHSPCVGTVGVFLEAVSPCSEYKSR